MKNKNASLACTVRNRGSTIETGPTSNTPKRGDKFELFAVLGLLERVYTFACLIVINCGFGPTIE